MIDTGKRKRARKPSPAKLAVTEPLGTPVDASYEVAAKLRKLGVDAHSIISGGGVQLSVLAAQRLLEHLLSSKRMWRVTRRQPYVEDEALSVSARTGYYVQAVTPREAAEFLKTKFSGDRAGFTVQRWEHIGVGAHGEVVGEFFVEGREERA
jgi:hypothetical protein